MLETAAASRSSRETCQTINWLLSPFEADDFIAGHWEKGPLHIKRHQPAYFKDFFALSDLDEIIGFAITNENVRTARDGQSRFIKEAGAEKTSICRLYELYYEGNTVVFRNIHQRCPAIYRVGTAISRFFGCYISTHLYATPIGQQGFGTHWDDHDIFALQLEGEKEWLLYENGPPLPRRSRGPREYRRQVLEGPAKVSHRMTLQAGDVLYFPRGVPHLVKCRPGTSSLHLTFGLYSETATQVLKRAIVEHAKRNPDLDAPLPLGYLTSPGEDAIPGLETLKAALADSSLLKKALLGLFADGVVGNRMAPCGHFEQLLHLNRVGLNTRLMAKFGPGNLVGDEGSLCIAAPGIRYAVEPGHRLAVRALVTLRNPRVADLAGDLSDADKVTLARNLIRVGLCASEPAGLV